MITVTNTNCDMRLILITERIVITEITYTINNNVRFYPVKCTFQNYKKLKKMRMKRR